MKKRWPVWVGVLVLALAAIVAFEPTHIVWGHLTGQSFYHGRPTSYWVKELKSKEPGVQTNTLKELADGGSEAVPVLIALLQRNRDREGAEAEVRWTAADVLGRIGPEAKAAVPALTEALSDRAPLVRSLAADALGKIGPEARSAIPALVAMLKTGERLSAVRALRRFRGESKAAVPDLIELLKDEDKELRWNAAETLGDMGPVSGSAVPALTELLQDKEAVVREHAAEALGEIGPPARSAIPALRTALKDPEKEVRDEADKALKRLEKGG